MLDVIALVPGPRLRIAGGLLAEAIANLGDGEWAQVRLPDPDGAPLAPTPEELCHATDMLDLL